ncbi:13984_t:CDS:2 [Entrophospora sp. SA101]|nr:6857_t:CDS:2 [Entrophospora sp. SA101]CAJ0830033.1 14661_t:CDS:2 [Entrophospora sp. SA101]CAJ0878126.1 13984_t:CDS:2 [Entrophospora sp. SA101]
MNNNKLKHYLTFYFFLIFFIALNNVAAAPAASLSTSLDKRAPGDNLGAFAIVGKTGVLAMHISLANHNTVIMIDKNENNPLKSADGTKPAIVALYHLDDNTVTPIESATDTFCSGGSWFGDGTLLNTGGDFEGPKGNGFAAGGQTVRKYTPGTNTLQEFQTAMQTKRWYPSVVTLADGKILIIGGSTGGTGLNNAKLNNPTYEIWSSNDTVGPAQLPLAFLADTLPFNLYPIVHIVPNEAKKNLIFVFANKKSIIYDLDTATVVKALPDLVGESPRVYPLTGTSVFLPLKLASTYKTEIMICGGGTAQVPNAPADSTCGRMDILAQNPVWEMDNFGGIGRVLPDAVILPDAKVLFLNGGGVGFAGFRKGAADNVIWASDKPVLTPVLYDPDTKTYTTLAASTVPRMYHSTVTLLADGTVFVAGSNPQASVNLNVLYPTEYRAEVFTPPNLQTGANRATIISVDGQPINQDTPQIVNFGKSITVIVQFTSTTTPTFTSALQHTGFSTHSSLMSQRYVELAVTSSALVAGTTDQYTLQIGLPPNPTLIASGPLWLNVL